MAKPKLPASIPVAPQPHTLELRDHSARVIAHLVECLYDHIVTYHKTQEAAEAVLDFTIHSLRRGMQKAYRDRHGSLPNARPNDPD